MAGSITLLSLVGAAVVASSLRDSDSNSTTAEAGGEGSEPSEESASPVESGTTPDSSLPVWECSSSGVLAIPFTDISVEPFSIEQEEAERAEHVANVRSSFGIVDDHPRYEALDESLARLERVADGRDYDLTIVEETVPNAFIITGGSIFLTTGLLDAMDDDQVTAILAHEVAHGVCRHLAKQIERRALAVATIESAVGDQFDIGDVYTAVLDDFIATADLVAYSKEDESEADLVSLDIARAAEFEPRHLASALEVLLGFEEGNPGRLEEFLSTHPPTRERIDAINDALG